MSIKKKYLLEIHLNTYGKFIIKTKLNGKEFDRAKYKFVASSDDRNILIDLLKSFYNSLSLNIELKNESMEGLNEIYDQINTIYRFKEYLYTIIDIYDTMHIEFSIGGPYFTIDVSQLAYDDKDNYTLYRSIPQEINYRVIPGFYNSLDLGTLKDVSRSINDSINQNKGV